MNQSSDSRVLIGSPKPNSARKSSLLNQWIAVGLVRALAASLAALLLAHTLMPEPVSSSIGAPWIALAIALLAIIRARAIWRKPSGRIAVVVLVAGSALWIANGEQTSWFAGANHFDSVILLLFGIGVFRAYLTENDIAAHVRHALTHGFFSHGSERIFVLYSGLTFVLSLAVVPIVGSISKACSLDAPSHLRLAMRAVGASMFILPTTVGAGAVNAGLNDFSWLSAMLIGAPLSVASLCLTRSSPARGTNQHLDEFRQPKVNRRLYSAIVAFVCSMVILKTLVGMATINALAVSLLLCGAIPLAFDSGPDRIIQELKNIAIKSSAEIVLFSACGVLMVVLSSGYASLLQSVIPAAINHALQTDVVQIVMIIAIVPLFAIIGIHPMVLWAAFFPTLHAYSNLPAVIEYLCWIFMFISAQLISPVSISAILGASSIERSSWSVSLPSHWQFVTGLTVLTAGYLYLLSWVLGA